MLPVSIVKGYSMPNLTKRIVDAAKPSSSEYFVWCSATPGFGVRIYPSGRKVFIQQLRVGPRQDTQRHKIGVYGPFTVEQARGHAEELIRAVANGRDPRREANQAKTGATIAQLCDDYMDAARNGLVLTRFGRPKSASTVGFDEGRITRHIKPLIGHLDVKSVTPADVQRMVDDIAAGKTKGVFKGKLHGKAVVAGGAGTAARVAGLLGGIFTWARRRQRINGPNPAHGIEKASTRTKDRVLSAEEFHRLGDALRAAEETQPAAVAALRLIALSGLRRSEAMGLRWPEVDETSQLLRLEASKTGQSRRVISRLALELLQTRKGKSATFVFPDINDAGSAHLEKPIADIFDSAGLADARSHDLRRSFASIAAEEGYSDATIGELLGHARRGVTARHYIRRPDPALIAAADRVAGRIAGLLGNREQCVVVPIADAAQR
jgi:integrase